MNEISKDAVRRREFLARLGKVGASLVFLALGYRLAGRKPKERSVSTSETQVFDFRLRLERDLMAVASGRDRRKSLRAALEALGGIQRFVQTGDRVLIKVNAAFASPPEIGATVHPDVVYELASLCFAAGAKQVIVADHPVSDSATVFRLTGIEAAAQQAGAQIRHPRPADFQRLSLPGARLLVDWPIFVSVLRECTKLIGVAVVKDHGRSGISMTLKNWYGLLGGQRSLLHQDIHRSIAELAQWFRPTFVVLDGTLSMYRNGPTGGSLSDLLPTEKMVVSTDPVAADAFGLSLLRRRLSEAPHLTQAATAGVGTVNFDLLEPQFVRAS